MAKNPIMALYELSTKEHFSLQFHLLSSEGPKHRPTFRIRATGRGISALGTGSTKQMAKTAAAASLLELLLSSPAQARPRSVPSLPRTQNQSSITVGSGIDVQPGDFSDHVSILQEACSKNNWCTPQYLEVPQSGSSEFCMQVSVKNLSGMGRGSTKQAAKHQAALMLLNAVKALSSDERKARLGRFDTAVERDGLRLERQKVLAPFLPVHLQMIPEEELKVLEKLMAESHLPCSKHLEFLDVLCQRINCTRNFSSLGKSHDGGHFCLLRLTTVPTSVFHGVGTSLTAAKEHAAMNALFHFRAMSRRAALETFRFGFTNKALYLS